MDWDLFVISKKDSGWSLLEETGWHSMLIAAVGPARVIRSLKVRASPYQTLIDDTIDEYLAAADIPPRPRGFDWYIRTPPGMTLNDVDVVLNRGVELGPSIAPTAEEVLAIFAREVDRIFSD